MKQRLKYTEYKNCRDIIKIDLHNDYEIIAIKSWNEDNHNYLVDFYLKERTIDKWSLLDEVENTEFNANFKTINSAILKQVSIFLDNGIINRYIDVYEYENKCLMIGNEQLEKGE